MELAGVKTCEPKGLAGSRVEGVVKTCCVGGKMVTTCRPEGSHWVKACTVVVIRVLVASAGCPCGKGGAVWLSFASVYSCGWIWMTRDEQRLRAEKDIEKLVGNKQPGLSMHTGKIPSLHRGYNRCQPCTENVVLSQGKGEHSLSSHFFRPHL